MKRALASATAALFLFAGSAGCGSDDDEGPAVTPAVTAEPPADAEALTGRDLECKDEIVRQMEDSSQETEDVPPECEGISEDRIFELAQIAEGEAG